MIRFYPEYNKADDLLRLTADNALRLTLSGEFLKDEAFSFPILKRYWSNATREDVDHIRKIYSRVVE